MPNPELHQGLERPLGMKPEISREVSRTAALQRGEPFTTVQRVAKRGTEKISGAMADTYLTNR